MAQLCYIAACNRLHLVEQRLCRWLLQRVDRTPGNELRLTQEFIASMLGDRRETINLAERHLQRLGFIRHSRGGRRCSIVRAWRFRLANVTSR